MTARALLPIAPLALAGAALLAAQSREDATHGFLAAALFFACAPLGALAIRLIIALTGGERQPGVAAALAPPMARMLWLWPILGVGAFAAPFLYPWAMGGVHSAYFAPVFVMARAIAVLAIWTWLSHLRQEETLSPALAAIGLCAHAITLCVISFDWINSLTARWATANMPMTLLAWQFLAGSAAAILATPRHPSVARDDFAAALAGGILGALYFAFISYLVVWYADIPEATSWYRIRAASAFCAPLAAALSFAALVLLFAANRRRWGAISALAALWLYIAWWTRAAESAAGLATDALLTAAFALIATAYPAPRLFKSARRSAP